MSLRKPNKRYALKQEDRILRIEEYLKNVLRVRQYYKITYDVEIPIINADQMPLHRNESCGARTMTMKNENTFVKGTFTYDVTTWQGGILI